MKLSEAIRLGAMMFPQGFDGWMDGETRCALAAACEASGIKPLQSNVHELRLGVNYAELLDRYHVLQIPAAMPVGALLGEEMPLAAVVFSLNDRFRWTREQIADWVETIEAQHPQKTESVTEEVTAKTN